MYQHCLWILFCVVIAFLMIIGKAGRIQMDGMTGTYRNVQTMDGFATALNRHCYDFEIRWNKVSTSTISYNQTHQWVTVWHTDQPHNCQLHLGSRVSESSFIHANAHAQEWHRNPNISIRRLPPPTTEQCMHVQCKPSPLRLCNSYVAHTALIIRYKWNIWPIGDQPIL